MTDFLVRWGDGWIQEMGGGGNDSEKGGDIPLRFMSMEKIQYSRKGPMKVELKVH